MPAASPKSARIGIDQFPPGRPQVKGAQGVDVRPERRTQPGQGDHQAAGQGDGAVDEDEAGEQPAVAPEQVEGGRKIAGDPQIVIDMGQPVQARHQAQEQVGNGRRRPQLVEQHRDQHQAVAEIAEQDGRAEEAEKNAPGVAFLSGAQAGQSFHAVHGGHPEWPGRGRAPKRRGKPQVYHAVFFLSTAAERKLKLTNRLN